MTPSPENIGSEEVADWLGNQDPVRRAEILRLRAARVAARAQAKHIEKGEDILVFELQGELAGIRAAECREVVRVENVTPVPDAREGLLGLLNVQNELICLVDIRPDIWPSLAATGDAFAMAIVLRHEPLRIAVGCDRVHGVTEVRKDQLDATSAFRFDSRFASLLSLSELLNPFQSALTDNQQ